MKPNGFRNIFPLLSGRPPLGRPGPVFLELPPDILFAEIDEKIVSILPVEALKPPPIPEASELQEAARTHQQRKQANVSGRQRRGHERLRGGPESISLIKPAFLLLLSTTGGACFPTIIRFASTTAVSPAVMTGLPQADVIIAAGIRFNWVLQSGQILFPNAKVVRIDIDPTRSTATGQRTSGWWGTAGMCWSQLTPLGRKAGPQDLARKTQESLAAFMTTELRTAKETPSDPIHPNRLVAKIMEVFGQRCLLCGRRRGHELLSDWPVFISTSAGVLIPAGALLGCLGTGIPFAMAAKLANPDKPVVVLNGDGSFGFNSMEFDTAVRHNIPIICVVNNDCAWGMIKHSQEMSLGNERCTCAELGMRHYEKMVEGLGGYGELVTKDEEIVPALKRAWPPAKPACINVVTDPTVTSPATVMFLSGLQFLVIAIVEGRNRRKAHVEDKGWKRDCNRRGVWNRKGPCAQACGHGRERSHNGHCGGTARTR